MARINERHQLLWGTWSFFPECYCDTIITAFSLDLKPKIITTNSVLHQHTSGNMITLITVLVGSYFEGSLVEDCFS